MENNNEDNLKDNTPTCAICFQNLDDNFLISSTPCYHSFHNHCIALWLGNSTVCPICRSPMTFTTLSSRNEQNEDNRKWRESFSGLINALTYEFFNCHFPDEMSDAIHESIKIIENKCFEMAESRLEYFQMLQNDINNYKNCYFLGLCYYHKQMKKELHLIYQLVDYPELQNVLIGKQIEQLEKEKQDFYNSQQLPELLPLQQMQQVKELQQQILEHQNQQEQQNEQQQQQQLIQLKEQCKQQEEQVWKLLQKAKLIIQQRLQKMAIQQTHLQDLQILVKYQLRKKRTTKTTI